MKLNSLKSQCNAHALQMLCVSSVWCVVVCVCFNFIIKTKTLRYYFFTFFVCFLFLRFIFILLFALIKFWQFHEFDAINFNGI